jgi:hypothetical protein
MLLLGTIAAVSAIWFLVILKLETQVKDKEDKIRSVEKNIGVTHTSIRLAEKYNEEMERNGSVLTNYEAQMAQGDLYRWVIRSLRDLQLQSDVSVTDFTLPQITDSTIPPKVPYKSAAYTIGGVARYHEFGSFLAGLENSSPFIRIKNVTLEATSSGASNTDEPEKLNFKVEFSTLVKPGSAPR